MNARSALLRATIALVFLPSASWSGPPWEDLAMTAHDSSRGCLFRKRRVCGRAVPVTPRAPEPRADDASPARSVRLAFDFNGPPHFLEVVTDVKSTMKVMGQEVVQRQSQTFYLQWTPRGYDKDGHGLLTFKIIGAKMNLDIGGVNIEYDSTVDQKAGTPPAEFFKHLRGAELELTIAPRDMSIKNVVGHDKLVRKLGQTNPQMEPLLKSILSKDALAHMVDLRWLPHGPVVRGETWNRRKSLNLGPIGGYDLAEAYVYDGRAKSLDHIRVQTMLTFRPVKDNGLPFAIQNADLKTTASAGEIVFDAQRGRLVTLDQSHTLAGKIRIEVAGMQTEVTLELTQVQRVRMTDHNPLPRR